MTNSLLFFSLSTCFSLPSIFSCIVKIPLNEEDPTISFIWKLSLTGWFFRVQDIDGSYFESFTALAWKQENQRQNAMKAAESSATEPPPQELEVGITPIDYSMPQNEKDKLYVEMLYTIANTVSCQIFIFVSARSESNRSKIWNPKHKICYISYT